MREKGEAYGGLVELMGEGRVRLVRKDVAEPEGSMAQGVRCGHNERGGEVDLGVAAWLRW